MAKGMAETGQFPWGLERKLLVSNIVVDKESFRMHPINSCHIAFRLP